MSEIKTKVDEHQVTGVMLGIITTEGAAVHSVVLSNAAQSGLVETKCILGKEFCLYYRHELRRDYQTDLVDAAAEGEWEQVFDIYFENHHEETCDIVYVPFGMFGDDIVAALVAFKTKPAT